MKNLVGETKADLHILEELSEAGIEIVEGPRSRGEVPYTLTGKFGDWNFARAWYYWMAGSKGEGLPLEVATELHNRKYPVKGKGQPNTYGQVIRVDGNCGCPEPAGSVRSYHIDTQKGLNVLADTIRTLHNMAFSGTNSEVIQQLYDKISARYVEWQTHENQSDVEWLKKLPSIVYDGMTVNELLVGIKGGSEVVSLAKIWESADGGKGVVQHFFEGGQITGFNYGFNYGNFSGPGQILNRRPEVDEKLRPHYEELKTLRPKAAGSLELCMQELEKPGPEYTGMPDADGSMSVKLAGR